MTHFFCRFSLLFFCLALTTGCSWKALDEVFMEPVPVALLAEPTHSEPPLDVHIAQAFLTDGKLQVKAYVEPKIALETSSIVVSLLGLREGRIVSEQTKSLPDIFLESHLTPGEQVALHFELEASELTEYQVRSSWGSDASQILKAYSAIGIEEQEARAQLADSPKQELSPVQVAALAPTPSKPSPPKKEFPEQAISKLELKELKVKKKITQCSIAPCDVLYTMVGVLKNSSDVPISEIELALGLFWQSMGTKARVPPEEAPLATNEKRIRLQKLVVPPGGKKKIKVNVDRPIPVVPGGGFVPNLRLLTFQQTNL